MQYISHYESPLGAITLAADEKGLTGLWFDREKYFGNTQFLIVGKNLKPFIPKIQESLKLENSEISLISTHKD